MYRQLKLFFTIFLLFAYNNSFATFLDTDTYCTNYGCVVVCDNTSCNVYDVYIIAGGGTVAAGNQLIYYTTNPVIGTGAGARTTNYRNSFLKTGIYPAGTGSLISINNQTTGGIFTDNGSTGFLDVNDNISSFGINNNTSISWVNTAADNAVASNGTNPLRHTFFYCSRGVNINIRARIVNDLSSGVYSDNVNEANINYNISADRTGTYSGITYGNTSRNPMAFNSSGLTNISSFNTFSTVAFFNNSTRVNNTAGTDINSQMRQCNKINLDYTFPGASLHLGDGIINYNIEYSFWRR